MSIYYSYIGSCRNRRKHTKAPTGYIEWHEWAEKKSKTHTQVQCPVCGYYVIWIKKNKGEQ